MIGRGLSRALQGIGRFASAGPREWEDFWYTQTPGEVGVFGGTQAGARVDPESSLSLSVVHACISLIAGSAAMLPAKTYRRLPNGGKEEARDHPHWRLLRHRPNEYQTAFEWDFQQTMCLLMRGNSYDEKIAGPAGVTSQLWPIHPLHLNVDWLDRKSGRQKVYDVSSAHDGRPRVLRADEVKHDLIMSLDGLKGLSPLGLAREGIGLGFAMQTYGSRFFGSGSRPAGVLSTEQDIRAEKRQEIAQAWNAAHAGLLNSNKIAVLGNGLKFQPMSVPPEDAQFLESRKFQVADIARFYGVPLWLIQQTESQTSWGSGIEQMGIAFVTYTLGKWLCLKEASLNAHVVRQPNTYFIEYDVDALLRGDLKSRFLAYQAAVNSNNPWLSVNEIRARENLNPIEGGDEPRVPLNTAAGPTGAVEDEE